MNQVSNFNDIIYRNGNPLDYEKVVKLQPLWWNGRDLTSLILKIFFIHFRDTIFIAEKDGEIVGFLIGFFSQYFSNEAYIHFIGIHPNFRKKGLGFALYTKFFNLCDLNNRIVIHSATSPINKDSIKFHTKLGFVIEPGDGEIDGFPVALNYHKKDNPKVIFKKTLSNKYRETS
ncbi:MAG: GNAT family N-acetyltransferase [Promethearchaeota archaeon]